MLGTNGKRERRTSITSCTIIKFEKFKSRNIKNARHVREQDHQLRGAKILQSHALRGRSPVRDPNTCQFTRLLAYLYLSVFHSRLFCHQYLFCQLATIHLAYNFAAYAFLSRREKGIVLESYEHIVLPISVLLISLLSRNEGLVECKAVSVILFGVQGMLITAKIIYFNSVTCELAQYFLHYEEYQQ